MDEDEVIFISVEEEPAVLIVEESQQAVFIVEEQQAVVLVIQEGVQGPKGDPGTKITVSNNAPRSPAIGDLWIDTQ